MGLVTTTAMDWPKFYDYAPLERYNEMHSLLPHQYQTTKLVAPTTVFTATIPSRATTVTRWVSSNYLSLSHKHTHKQTISKCYTKL